MTEGMETPQSEPEQHGTMDKMEDAAGKTMEAGGKVVGATTEAVSGTFDKIDDQMDKEVEIVPGISMPFVTLIMGILVIVGVMLPWVKVDLMGMSASWSGLDLFTDSMIDTYFEPMLAIVFGILMLVFAAIKKPMLSSFCAIGAIVVIGLFMLRDLGDASLGIGYWISFIGALLGLIFGFLKK